MVSALLVLSALAASVAANPIQARASCTFKDAAAAVKGKTSCTTIVLDSIVVPAGKTLDLTGLKAGTHVSPSDSFPLTIVNSGTGVYSDVKPLGHFQGQDHLWLQGMGRPAHLRVR